MSSARRVENMLRAPRHKWRGGGFTPASMLFVRAPIDTLARLRREAHGAGEETCATEEKVSRCRRLKMLLYMQTCYVADGWTGEMCRWLSNLVNLLSLTLVLRRVPASSSLGYTRLQIPHCSSA